MRDNMAVFKCKMCGAVLEDPNNETIVNCAYCGTQQMLPGVDIPSGFSDEAEVIRIKNHRDDIDKSNKKVKKYFWIAFASLAVLPTIPPIFSPLDYAMGEGFLGELIGALFFCIAYSIAVVFISLPALITSIVYIFAKPKTPKTRKVISVFNVFSKIFLFSGIGFWSMTGLGGIVAVKDDLSFGFVFLLMAICNVGILIVSFMKKDYKY